LAEVERLIKADRRRHGRRDATLILIGYRHGLVWLVFVILLFDQGCLKSRA
jgi:hypothetical protein